MASTGATIVTSGLSIGTDITWSNPGRITANDGSSASLGLIPPQQSQYLTGTGLGFSVSSYATITGIELGVYGNVVAGASQIVGLTKNGTTQAGSTKTGSQGGTLSLVTYGSSSDLWGTTWTPSEVNASTFGGFYRFANFSSGMKIANVDYVQVNVYYTLPTTRYWVGGTANWDTTAGTKWAYTSGGVGGASVPDTTNDVFFDASSGSGNTTFSLSTNIKSLDMTGYTGTLTHSAGQILTFLSNGGTNIVKFAGTYILGDPVTSEIDFDATSNPAVYNFTTGGNTFGNILVGPYHGGNTVTLQDNLNMGVGTSLTLRKGNFDANNKNLSIGLFYSSNGNTRTLTMGSGIWSLSGDDTTGNTWDITASTGLTLNSNTSTIKFTSNSGGTATFIGGGKTYYNFWNSIGTMEVVRNADTGNTFNNFKIDPGQAQLFGSDTTTTVASFEAVGTSANPIFISNDNINPFTISKSSGTVNVAYCYISLSVTAGGATWNSYTTSGNTDGGGNTGWNFNNTFGFPLIFNRLRRTP